METAGGRLRIRCETAPYEDFATAGDFSPRLCVAFTSGVNSPLVFGQWLPAVRALLGRESSASGSGGHKHCPTVLTCWDEAARVEMVLTQPTIVDGETVSLGAKVTFVERNAMGSLLGRRRAAEPL